VGLDSKRNKILEFNICVGFAVLVHTVASTVYGVFGMNFILPMDSGAVHQAVPGSQRWTFNLVAILVAVAAVALWCAIMFTLRWLGYIHILPFGPRVRSLCRFVLFVLHTRLQRSNARQLVEKEAFLEDRYEVTVHRGREALQAKVVQ
jgi:hypothetical protein